MRRALADGYYVGGVLRRFSAEWRRNGTFADLRGERVVNIVANIECFAGLAAVQDLHQAVGSGLGIRDIFDGDDGFETAAERCCDRACNPVRASMRPVKMASSAQFREARERRLRAGAIFPRARFPGRLGPQ